MSLGDKKFSLIFQNNKIFDIFKTFNNNPWINIYYPKKQTLVVYWTGSFVPFCSVVPFLGKFGPKTENCQSELKFGT